MLLYKVGSQRVNIDLKLRNRKMLNSVYRLIVLYPSCLGTIGLVYLGLLQALVVVPMLVQSCLDAFLATVVEVKGSPRASPRVLFRCCFSSRPTSRSSLAPVPLGSTIFSSDARGPPGSTFGCGHSTPSNRLSAYVPHDPRVVFFRARVPIVFLCTAETARGVLTLSPATSLHYHTSTCCFHPMLSLCC